MHGVDISTYSTYILLAISWLIPLASSFLSRQHWPQEITGILTLLLASVGGFASEWFQDPSHFHLGNATFKALLAYVLAAFAHSKIWSGTTTNDKALAFPRRVPPGGVQPGHEPNTLSDYYPEGRDSGQADVLLILLVIVVLVCFGFGFLVKWLFVIAVIALLFIALRFVLGGRRGV
jgi:hypothetical protein